MKSRAKEKGTLVGTRFQPDLLSAVDSWRKNQEDLPTRPEAVRRLVELGMSSSGDQNQINLFQPVASSIKS